MVLFIIILREYTFLQNGVLSSKIDDQDAWQFFVMANDFWGEMCNVFAYKNIRGF